MRQEGTPLDHETDHSQSEIERPKLKRKEAAGAVRPRKIADVRAALSRAFPGRWRDRDLRPQHRAGVEYVMGFCTKEQHRHFLEVCPAFEKQIVDNGIRLIKYWLEVSNKKQKRRFEARIDDRIRARLNLISHFLQPDSVRAAQACFLSRLGSLTLSRRLRRRGDH